MPLSQDTPTVRAIHRLRSHSKDCHNLQAREALIRIERQMIALLVQAPQTLQ